MKHRRFVTAAVVFVACLATGVAALAAATAGGPAKIKYLSISQNTTWAATFKAITQGLREDGRRQRLDLHQRAVSADEPQPAGSARGGSGSAAVPVCDARDERAQAASGEGRGAERRDRVQEARRLEGCEPGGDVDHRSGRSARLTRSRSSSTSRASGTTSRSSRRTGSRRRRRGRSSSPTPPSSIRPASSRSPRPESRVGR